MQDVSFELNPGQVMLVVGASGSGKSTLARAIAGLVPTAFPGDWSGAIRTEGDVGIVFQDPQSQLVMDRAGDDVAFGLESRAWPLGRMRARVPEALAEVGLSGFERRHSNRLSGGEQQRLALAGVLAPGPQVVVLDEPSANLDPYGATALFEQVRRLRAVGSASAVLVEHRVEQAWSLADVVLALGADGRPIDVGEPATVLGRSGSRMRSEGIWLPDALSGGAARRRAPRPAKARDALSSSQPAVAPRVGADPILVFEEARFAYPESGPAVRDISLQIDAGQRVALVGPNGSGKTTLLRLALGLLRPQAGRVGLLGDDPARMPAARLGEAAGYVVQDPELGFLGDTVAEELAVGLDADSSRRAAELADRLGLPLDRFGERSPYRLSGGEQRRLSLVTALARRPRLLVLDEPTFGQDRRGHEALVAAILELVGQGTAVLAATHDERFVTDVATRRVALDDGWIVADDQVGGQQ